MKNHTKQDKNPNHLLTITKLIRKHFAFDYLVEQITPYSRKILRKRTNSLALFGHNVRTQGIVATHSEHQLQLDYLQL